MRKLMCAAALIGCLAVPGIGQAGPTPAPEPEYGGRIERDPNAFFGFDVVNRNGHRVVTNMFVINIPTACFDPGDDRRQTGPLEGSLRVRGGGRFRGTRTNEFRPRGTIATGLKYTVRGRLDGSRAKGTINIRIEGSNCYTGTLSWRAKKPPPPLPKVIISPLRG